jgi:RNA polymerase sigma-70 factor, ECF subfamily
MRTGLCTRALVERARAGEPEAFAELYRRYAGDVYRYQLSNVGDVHDAEDLTSQTFVRVLEAIGRFEWRRRGFSAWLFTIARNVALDHLRLRGRRLAEPLREVRALAADVEALEAIGRQRVFALTRLLPHEQRQVLALKFAFELRNGDVAAVLGKTEGAVKQLQRRGLAALAAEAL